MSLILLLVVVSASRFSIPLTSKQIKLSLEPVKPLSSSISMPMIPLKEISTLEYTIKMGIGNPPQMLNLGLNLNNDFMIIPLDTCYCHRSENKYSPQNSLNFESSFKKVNFSSFSYNFEGYWAKDCILIGKKIIKFTEFIAIQNDNIPDWVTADGFFGLGFYANNSHFTTLYRLRSEHRIEEMRFSVFFNNPNTIKKKSMLTIGYWDSEQYGESGTTWKVPVYSNNTGWQASVTLMQIKDQIVDRNIYLAIFDLTSTSLKIPNSTFHNSFLPKLPQSANCNLYHSSGKEYYLICNCEGLFPTLYFTINSQKLSIDPQSYIYYNKEGYCSILVQPNLNQNSYIFGIPFFRQFYAMFDMDNRNIYLKRAIRHEQDFKESSFKVYQSGLAVVVVFALALGGFYVRKGQAEYEYQRV